MRLCAGPSLLHSKGRRFSKIPSNSASSFDEFSKLFVNNFIRGQRYKRSSSSLLTIEQGEMKASVLCDSF